MTENTKQNIAFAITILTGVSALVSIYMNRQAIKAMKSRVEDLAVKAKEKVSNIT